MSLQVSVTVALAAFSPLSTDAPEPAGFSGLTPTYLCLHCWPPAQPLSVPHASVLRSLEAQAVGCAPALTHSLISDGDSVPLPPALGIVFIVCPALLFPP